MAHVTAQDDVAADVAMFRGNPARTGELPGPGPDPHEAIVKLWTFPTGGQIVSSPAVVDGVVYVGSRDGYLYAFDAISSGLNWSIDVDANESSPTVAGGVVYIGSYSGLYAIDAATGQQKWFFSSGAIESSPAVVDGVVYVGSQLGLIAIDADSGEQIWILDPFGLNIGEAGSSPAVVDGIVYVADDSLQLSAIDASTAELGWKFEAGDWTNDYPTSPAVADGMVYIVNNYDDQLYAIDATAGQEAWAVDIRGRNEGGGSSYNSAPAVAGGIVYAAGGVDSLFALDAATGEQRWVFPAQPTLDFAPPVVVDGIVYAGSSDGLYAIDAVSGQQLWSFSTDDPILSSPAVVSGVIYIATGSQLYAISNPTPVMRTATAQAEATGTAQANLDATSTAEAQATATAQANEYATQVAAANITATAQAHLDATATSIAGATATSEAQAIATAEAIQLSWQNYFWTDIRNAFSTKIAELPGMSVLDHGGPGGPGAMLIPPGWSHASDYPIAIAGGSASAIVTLLIYPSKADADTAMETMSGGLIRSGWESRKGDGLDHNHACLSVERTSWSEAVCYMTRDDALIVSYSTIGLANPDAALMNAVDLANAMNDAYNEIDRPQ